MVVLRTSFASESLFQVLEVVTGMCYMVLFCWREHTATAALLNNSVCVCVPLFCFSRYGRL